METKKYQRRKTARRAYEKAKTVPWRVNISKRQGAEMMINVLTNPAQTEKAERGRRAARKGLLNMIFGD